MVVKGVSFSCFVMGRIGIMFLFFLVYEEIEVFSGEGGIKFDFL